MFTEELISILTENNISNSLIEKVIDSGYIIRHFADPFSGKTFINISDRMYGTKQFSSVFDIESFINYINGKYEFPELPKFRTFKVKSIYDIKEILSDSIRKKYIKDGRLSYRGQTAEYYLKREIPNPVRKYKDGRELSIMPGLYRQDKNNYYSFKKEPTENYNLHKIYQFIYNENEKNNLNFTYPYDAIRVEQHYASQTAGLDVTFDIETAIFFATNKFTKLENGKHYYKKIPKGEHTGVIYGFCFRDPSVPKSQYLIRDFDLFKQYKPERILRQYCGLPRFSTYEVNIAITDLDFIIYLDNDFEYNQKNDFKYYFPNIEKDKFYRKVLEFKNKNFDILSEFIEYDYSAE